MNPRELVCIGATSQQVGLTFCESLRSNLCTWSRGGFRPGAGSDSDPVSAWSSVRHRFEFAPVSRCRVRGRQLRRPIHPKATAQGSSSASHGDDGRQARPLPAIQYACLAAPLKARCRVGALPTWPIPPKFECGHCLCEKCACIPPCFVESDLKDGSVVLKWSDEHVDLDKRMSREESLHLCKSMVACRHAGMYSLKSYRWREEPISGCVVFLQQAKGSFLPASAFPHALRRWRN